MGKKVSLISFTKQSTKNVSFYITLYYYDILLGLYLLLYSLPTVFAESLKKKSPYPYSHSYSMPSEATPFESASCFSKRTKQPNKNVYPLVIFWGIHNDDLKNPHCEPQWLLLVLQFFKKNRLFIRSLKGVICEYIIKNLCQLSWYVQLENCDDLDLSSGLCLIHSGSD